MIRKTKNLKNAISIAEVIVALAIVAVMLIAVAAAFNASAKNSVENEKIFRVVNSARVALAQMVMQIRSADNFNPDDPNNRCSFFTDNDQDITYHYDDTEEELYLITNSDSQQYLLCDNVVSMCFTKTPTIDGDIKSVSISMTVASGNYQKTLVAAAVARKNI